MDSLPLDVFIIFIHLMYGGGLRWNNGELIIGANTNNYENHELKAIQLVRNNRIQTNEPLTTYWERFAASDVPSEDAVQFMFSLCRAYISRLDVDAIYREAGHRDYSTLLRRAIDRMARYQYANPSIQKGVRGVYGLMKGALGLGDRLSATVPIGTVPPKWEPPGRWYGPPNWGPVEEPPPEEPPQGWDNFEPPVLPAPTGWEPEPERRRLPMFEELSQRAEAEQRPRPEPMDPAPLGPGWKLTQQGWEKSGGRKRSRRRSKRKRTRHL
jgi:hypothetical protein